MREKLLYTVTEMKILYFFFYNEYTIFKIVLSIILVYSFWCISNRKLNKCVHVGYLGFTQILRME